MAKQEYEIECGRCGETRCESLSEDDARLINEGTGPVYYECERCGKMTGWMKATKPGPQKSEENHLTTQSQSPGSQVQEPQILNGQERMASRPERHQVNELLRQS